MADLHEYPYSERYKLLKQIGVEQSTNDVPKHGFNITPSIEVKKPDQVLVALKECSGFVSSEGAVIKSSKMKYDLSGLSRKQLKWKKMAEVHAIVLDKLETKTKGVFTLFVGVRIPSTWKVPESKIKDLKGTKYMYIGKTFNVSAPVQIGDTISMDYHTLNLYKSADKQYITAYEPRFIEVIKSPPEDAEKTVSIAKQKELLDVKQLQAFPMDDSLHQGVMQIHYRGQSAHMDFRIKVDDHLLGMTLFIEKPNVIMKDVQTVTQAKEIERNWNTYFKLRNVPSEEKTQVSWKSPEPLAWLNVQGVVEPGQVGATKTEIGVFSIVDRPEVSFGVQKPYFKEFFLHGKLFTGRWVVRYLANPWSDQSPREAFVFLTWKPLDQTPYVLSDRARKKKWIPPVGVSCLPPEIRKNVPSNFKYWVRNDISERLAIRDGLIDAINKKAVKVLQNPPDITEPLTVDVVLQHHWYRGPLVVRGGPTNEHWDLRLKHGNIHFVLYENIQSIPETLAEFHPANESWMDIKGVKELKPGSSGNPTKNTPAFIETISTGQAQILESSSSFMKVQLSMSGLKGLFTFMKPEQAQNLWVVKKEGVD